MLVKNNSRCNRTRKKTQRMSQFHCRLRPLLHHLLSKIRGSHWSLAFLQKAAVHQRYHILLPKSRTIGLVRLALLHHITVPYIACSSRLRWLRIPWPFSLHTHTHTFTSSPSLIYFSAFFSCLLVWIHSSQMFTSPVRIATMFIPKLLRYTHANFSSLCSLSLVKVSALVGLILVCHQSAALWNLG